ncbi:MAG: glycosyltransferase family 4 protein [Bergeyella sp.]|nr:glycosyltransferase family 4 protein [Bergeyella sp.]
MKYKVLLDLERLKYPYSGIAQVFKSLARGFVFYSPKHLKIDFFAPENEEISHFKPNVILWKKWHKFFEYFSNSYNIVHVSHQLSPYFSGNYRNTKKLVTLHDFNFLHEKLSGKKKRKVMKRVQRSLRYADYIVCISHFVKKDFEVHRHLFKLPKLKEVFVAYNGLTFPKESDYRGYLPPFLRERSFLLNIGELVSKKNQETLIPMILALNREIDLVLVASGGRVDYEDEIVELIKLHKLQGKVHILKNITNEVKYALIQSSSGVCLPSLAEGFGLPVIEAMYFGKPIFLSSFTSFPEIGGSLAYYFKNFDPEEMAATVEKGLEDFKRRSELKILYKKWALRFDEKMMAKSYLEIYDKILSI